LPCYDELIVENGDRIGLTDYKIHIACVIQEDRSALFPHLHTLQVYHDGVSPTGKLHRSTGISGHGKSTKARLGCFPGPSFEFDRAGLQLQELIGRVREDIQRCGGWTIHRLKLGH
jgi:hypothetical protein